MTRGETRMTRQRSALLDELKATHDHPTADELHSRLRVKLPRVSLATVYRNLERLVEDGRIRVIDIPGRPRRFDGDLSSHYHVRCVNCGRVDDVKLDKVPNLGALVAKTGAYGAVTMRLEFEGLCARCRKQQKAAEKTGGA